MFDAIAHTARDTPGFVQELCDALWQMSDKGTTLEESDIQEALAIIFAREHDHFTFAIKQLTAQQTRVLQRMAPAPLNHRPMCSCLNHRPTPTYAERGVAQQATRRETKNPLEISWTNP